MTKKPTVTTLQSGFNSTETLNTNLEALRDAFDNTLSLDGSLPNAMEADLDLNGNNIIGAAGLLINGTDYLVDIEAAKAAALLAQAGAETAETNAETAESNAESSETAAGLSATASAASASASAASAVDATNNGAAQVALAAEQVVLAGTAKTAAELAETNAETSESNAAASATNAATSATTASTGASTASTKASEAATSATNAATSATESETAKTGAETARDAALAALDSFDDRYLGVKTSDPTVDNDGDALVVGAIYFNSNTNLLYVYNGTTWQVTANAASGDLVSTNNLSDLTSAATARTNLGLGTAATTDSTDYATAAQGTKADTATQPADLGTAAATDSTDYATAAQGAIADSAVQPNDSPTFAGLTVDTDTLYVDAANNRVGINTTSPDSLFTVKGQTVIGSFVAESANLTNLTSGTPPQLIAGYSVPPITWTPSPATQAVFSRNGNMQIDILASATTLSNLNFSDTDEEEVGQISYNHNSDSMLFSTDNTVRMRINSSGSVGIGTTSPNHLLDVEGSGDVAMRIGSTGTGDADAYLYVDGGDTGESAVYFDTDGVNQAYISLTGGAGNDFNIGTPAGAGRNIDFQPDGILAMRIKSSGNVGIGTVSPSYQLSVGRNDNGIYSDEDGMYIIQNTSNFDVLSLQSSGIVEYRSDDQDDTSITGHIFYTDGSERMRLTSSGHLLMGTTSLIDPVSENSIQILGNTSAIKWCMVTKSHSRGRVHINTDVGGISDYFITGATNVGYISQTLTSTAYNTSSDYRLKTDAQPMTGASARVQALNPVNFEWIADGSRVDGFLAHEAQAVVPESVTGTKDAMRDEEYEVTPAVEATYDDDGNEITAAVDAVMGTRSVPDYQAIDQSKLVPLLTAALQEALTEIAALKVRVAALEVGP